MAEEALHLSQDANPTETSNAESSSAMSAVNKGPAMATVFPPANESRRISNYEYFTRLLLGEHFEAFNIRINDERYTREYSRLRYVMVNFAGLISKVVADFLFSEPPKFKSSKKDPKEQAWIDAFVAENNLNIQNYESALSNSATGDALYKLRIDKRFGGESEAPTIIAEDITPTIYFPEVNGFNVREEPRVTELCWEFWKGKDKFLRKEIHEIGKIRNEVWSMENNKVMTKQPITILGDDTQDEQETLIERSLVIHIANWKIGRRFFGISDYYDLDRLFYAVNNRMTKVDNILDKHGDPILAVPAGVLDEKGNVKKKSMGVIEMGEDGEGKPEYIVWDAKLEAAFEEVDKLVEFLFMTSEISPDVLGMGKGTADTGRALKYRILRTLAKVARKKLYYDLGLKELIYRAQLLAKAHNVKVGGLDAPANPSIPDIEWQDGLPMDMQEQVDIEQKRVDGGNTSVVDSIMRLDGVDEDTAKKKAEAIKKETEVEMPTLLKKPFTPSNAAGGKGGDNSSPVSDGTKGGK